MILLLAMCLAGDGWSWSAFSGQIAKPSASTIPPVVTKPPEPPAIPITPQPKIEPPKPTPTVVESVPTPSIPRTIPTDYVSTVTRFGLNDSSSKPWYHSDRAELIGWVHAKNDEIKRQSIQAYYYPATQYHYHYSSNLGFTNPTQTLYYQGANCSSGQCSPN